MKKLSAFVKTSIVGGALVLVPLLILYMLISELVELIIALVFPILELLPGNFVDWFGDPVFPAIIVLLTISFLAGLAMRSSMVKSISAQIEKNFLEKIPMYRAVTKLTRGALGEKSNSAFSCGVLELTPGVREIVYIAEDTGNGYLTILTPLSPSGFNGPLKIVQSDKVERISASVGEASIAISEWGVGLQEIVDNSTQST